MSLLPPPGEASTLPCSPPAEIAYDPAGLSSFGPKSSDLIHDYREPRLNATANHTLPTFQIRPIRPIGQTSRIKKKIKKDSAPELEHPGLWIGLACAFGAWRFGVRPTASDGSLPWPTASGLCVRHSICPASG
jgi:hypothetical protein